MMDIARPLQALNYFQGSCLRQRMVIQTLPDAPLSTHSHQMDNIEI